MLFLLISCIDKNRFSFSKIKLTNRMVLDTLENLNDSTIQLLLVKDYGRLGEFKTSICFVFKNDSSNFYELDQEGLDIRISKSYIALVKPDNKYNFGWFLIKDKEFKKNLPDIDLILKKIQYEYPDFFIREDNGLFSVFKDNKQINSFNYGNYLSGIKNYDFNNLDYALYKYDNRKLIKISDNGNDLLVQKNGLYFVPNPGYGIIKIISKDSIVSDLKSFLHRK